MTLHLEAKSFQSCRTVSFCYSERPLCALGLIISLKFTATCFAKIFAQMRNAFHIAFATADRKYLLRVMSQFLSPCFSYFTVGRK